jgi:hypothetical protein
VQLPNGNGPLPDFGMHGLLDRLLDFGKLFVAELEAYASAHAD